VIAKMKVNAVFLYISGILRSHKMKDGTIQWPKKKDKKTNTCGLSNIENIMVNR
jgi:hypothetical protein